MERVIKFRAWDKDRKIMVYNFKDKGWSKSTYRLLCNDEDALFCGNYLDNGDWNEPILMQFTNLKGQEREGDLRRGHHRVPAQRRID